MGDVIHALSIIYTVIGLDTVLNKWLWLARPDPGQVEIYLNGTHLLEQI